MGGSHDRLLFVVHLVRNVLAPGARRLDCLSLCLAAANPIPAGWDRGKRSLVFSLGGCHPPSATAYCTVPHLILLPRKIRLRSCLIRLLPC